MTAVHDPKLLPVLEHAERHSAPKPAWYLTLGHAPDMATGYAAFWDLTHRAATPSTVKELMQHRDRTVARLRLLRRAAIGTGHRSGPSEEEAASCARHSATRALATQRPGDDDAVFDEV